MLTKTKTIGVSNAILMVALFSACAYQFTGTRAEIPGVSSRVSSPYRIFVPVADNTTNSLGMEAELPAALARVIAGLTNVRIVGSKEEANLILAPRVVRLDRGRGLGTLQGSSETSSAAGLAEGAVTAREFKVSTQVELDLFESTVNPTHAAISSAKVWVKRWTKIFEASGNYDSSLRLIPAKGSSSSSIINHSRERLLLRSLSEDLARKIREQVFQGF